MRGEIITDRIYGEFEITDPLVLEIIDTPLMQRLKGVAQMGSYKLAYPHMCHTRFEHSLGVYHLLNRFGAPREEQIAGLLHDSSHGVFSHVIDYLRGTANTQEWQDNSHERFLSLSEIPSKFSKFGLDVKRILNHTEWPLLDCPLPDLCADRLDYTLRDGVVCKVMNPDDTLPILENIAVSNGKLIFTNADYAREYAQTSLVMCRDFTSGCVWGTLQFDRMAKALELGLSDGYIREADLMTTDDVVLQKLEESGSPEIKSALNMVRNVGALQLVLTDEVTAFPFRGKYRGQDPLVYIDGKLIRVSTIYPELEQLAEDIKSRLQGEKYIRIRN